MRWLWVKRVRLCVPSHFPLFQLVPLTCHLPSPVPQRRYISSSRRVCEEYSRREAAVVPPLDPTLPSFFSLPFLLYLNLLQCGSCCSYLFLCIPCPFLNIANEQFRTVVDCEVNEKRVAVKSPIPPLRATQGLVEKVREPLNAATHPSCCTAVPTRSRPNMLVELLLDLTQIREVG